MNKTKKENMLKHIIGIPKDLEKTFHIKFSEDKDVLIIYPKHKIKITGFSKEILI
jgi:hypothetical protein